jgi:O-antigen ligase
LLVSPVTADAYFLPKLVAARLVVITLLVILGLAGIRGRLRLRRTPLDIPLAAFIVSALISTILAINTNLAFFGSYGRYEGFLTILLYALLFWLAVQSLDGAHAATLVLRGLLGAAFVVSVLSILQVALGSSISPGPTETGFSFGGVLRGYATFGNPNALGAFLGMLLPVAVWEFLASRSASGRWLAANVVIVLALGLVTTFSRSAWLGAGIGVVMVLLVNAPRRLRWATLLGPLILVAVIGGASRLSQPSANPSLIQAAGGRLNTLGAPLATASGQFRLHVWVDSLALIASRPIFGYGPDSFGLVYPRFETGNWAPGAIIDRPHDEPLGVAATQGLIGLAAYGTMLVAIVMTFWNRRHDLQSVALFGGVVAYLFYTMLNFSILPATLPFWIFTAAAIAIWRPGRWVKIQLPGRIVGRIIGVGLLTVTAVSTLPLVAAPYQADAAYRSGLDAVPRGQREEAQNEVERARVLASWQSTYAVAAGSLALRLDSQGDAGAGADWAGARRDFLAAAQLGSFIPAAYRYLALADAALGQRQDAIAAARMALQLDRFDAANQAELARVQAQ